MRMPHADVERVSLDTKCSTSPSNKAEAARKYLFEDSPSKHHNYFRYDIGNSFESSTASPSGSSSFLFPSYKGCPLDESFERVKEKSKLFLDNPQCSNSTTASSPSFSEATAPRTNGKKKPRYSSRCNGGATMMEDLFFCGASSSLETGDVSPRHWMTQVFDTVERVFFGQAKEGRTRKQSSAKKRQQDYSLSAPPGLTDTSLDDSIVDQNRSYPEDEMWIDDDIENGYLPKIYSQRDPHPPPRRRRREMGSLLPVPKQRRSSISGGGNTILTVPPSDSFQVQHVRGHSR